MYLRSFLCEEVKIKQRTHLKKELCEIGEEAIWESRFSSFFSFATVVLWLFFGQGFLRCVTPMLYYAVRER